MQLQQVQQIKYFEATITNTVPTTRKMIQMGVDSLQDPMWEMKNNLGEYGNNFESALVPIEYMISMSELWAMANIDPISHFVTWVMSQEAYTRGWKFTKYENEEERIPKELNTRLKELTRDYDLKKIHARASFVSRIFGRALIFKVPNNPGPDEINVPPVRLIVFPIASWQIYYNNDTGRPDYYQFSLPWGRQYRFTTVPAKDAVLYVHKTDPTGNGYQGISEIYSIYRTQKYKLNITDGFGTGMSQKGISMLWMKDPEFTLNRLQEYRDAWGQPSEYNILFSTPETEIGSIAGNMASFDLLETNESFARDAASGTGVAVSRLDGTQRGQVSGSQTDQDNYYSILSSMQEDKKEYLISLYYLLDESIVDAFAVSFDVEPKLDKRQRAEIDSINAGTAVLSVDFMPYNTILQRFFNVDPVPGGEINATLYIQDNLREEIDPLDPNNFGGSNAPKKPQDTTKATENSSKSNKAPRLEKKFGRDEQSEFKYNFAQYLTDLDWSYTKINNELKKICGSGYSNSDLKELRK